MKLDDALAPGVAPDTFFLDYVPELFEARRELFAKASEVALIVSVHLTDTDQRYTYEFRPDGCTVEADEMIDFPVATITGPSTQWEDLKRHVLTVARPLEERAHEHTPPNKVTRDFLDALERFDGIFKIKLTADDLDEPIALSIILNDYDAPSGAPELRITAAFETGEQLARDEVHLSDLDSHVRVGGDMSLGLEVGGLILKHFPELDG